MKSFFADRVRIVLVAVNAVLVAAVAVLFATRPDPASSDAAATRKAMEALRAEAQDSNARSVLRNAAIALEVMYSEQQDFSDAATVLPQIEPNLSWLETGTAQAGRAQVLVQIGPQNDRYQLTTQSESGKTYGYTRDEMASVTRTCVPGCSW